MQYSNEVLEEMDYVDLVDVVNQMVRQPGGADDLLGRSPLVIVRTVDVLRNLIADVESQIENRRPRQGTDPHAFASWRAKAIRYREVLKEQLRRFETVAREHYCVTLFDFVLLVSERLEAGEMVAVDSLLSDVRILPWGKTMREILDDQADYVPAAVGT